MGEARLAHGAPFGNFLDIFSWGMHAAAALETCR